MATLPIGIPGVEDNRGDDSFLGTSPCWPDQFGSVPTDSFKSKLDISNNSFRARALNLCDLPKSDRLPDRTDLHPSFFNDLLSPNYNERAEALIDIVGLVRSAIEAVTSVENENAICSQFLRRHLGTISRLSSESPFIDVRENFAALLPLLEDKGFEIPQRAQISRFFKNQDLKPISELDKCTTSLLQDIYCAYGRISGFTRVMLFHPRYLEKFFNVMQLLLRGPGLIPYTDRNYIAILASSQMRSNYLVKMQQEEFLMDGGDETWLESVDNAPRKLYNLLPLIEVLATSPWVLTANHVEALLKAGADSWSIGELVHAIAIVVTFTALAGYVFGCGLVPEPDLRYFDRQAFDSVSSDDEAFEDSMSDIIKVLENINREGLEAAKPEEKDKIFADADSGSRGVLRQDDDTATSQEWKNYIRPGHSPDSIDFDVKSKEYAIFRSQDYSWKEHGYSYLSQYYSEMAPLLDDLFHHTYYMTDRTFSRKHMDTFPFRRAIWHYVHRVKGLEHDDFNYREINLMIKMNMKVFLKKLVSCPSELTPRDFRVMGPALRSDERCHVVLLAMEAKRQADLLYALRALTQHMKNVRR